MQSSTTRKLLIAAAILVPTVWSVQKLARRALDAEEASYTITVDARDEARAQAREAAREAARAAREIAAEARAHAAEARAEARALAREARGEAQRAAREARNQVRGEPIFTRSFDVGAGGSLAVELSDSDVIVETGGSRVEVEVRADASDMDWAQEVFERMRFRAEASGSTVAVEANDADISRSEWMSNRGVSFTTHVRIPKRFDVRVTTSDGDIVIGSIEGSADVRTSDGDVRLSGVEGPELRIRSADGDLSVGTARVELAEITTSDGDVHVEQVSGQVTVRSSDGDIWVSLGDVRGADIRTSDGDILLQASTDLHAELDLEAEDLSVARGFALQGSVSENRVVGTLNGGGPLIQVRTNDGSVRLSATR
jgi:DUF4097 and DUF4098 domain-containing protein YvlB